MIYQSRKFKIDEYKEKYGSLSYYHSKVIDMSKAEQTTPKENQVKIGDAETSKNDMMTINGMPQTNTRTPLILTIFSVVAYILLFTSIYYSYGQAMAISATIPVIVVGWFYGFMPGICAGVLSYPVNIIMYILFGAGWLEGMIVGGGGIPGTCALILIGAIIGRMRDLSTQLKNHRDKLDELVKRRTEELQKSNIMLEEENNQRKLSDEKLQETKDNFENIIESSLDGIMVSDRIGYVTRVNNYFLEMLSYRKEEAVGKFVAEFTPFKRFGIYESTTGELVEITKEFVDHANTMIAKLLEEGKATNWEAYYLRKDGKVVPIEQNIVCLYDNEGERTEAVSIIRDITERKKFEEALKKSEEKFQNLIENANDAVVSINIDGIIVTLNKKFEDMYGYTREELLGQSAIMLVPPDSREKQKKALEKFKTNAKMEGHRRTLETIAFGKDGKEFPVETSMFGLEIQGEYILTSFIRDITERKKIEQKLLQSEKLKSLGELSGGVAHDFNNVLAAILGRVQLLKMQIKSPLGKQEKRKTVLELRKGLEIIERASLDGAETVRRIQEFSRRRDDDKHFRTIDINEIIDNALEFTRTKWKDDVQSKGIKVNIQKEFSPIPPTSGSAAELREVFTNLINNAIDAMPQGGHINIKTFTENNHISIKVEDTGAGIPTAIRDRIFDPFFTTKGFQSSGLGMSVSYGIINRHRGTITADSVEGKGTTFTINLPILDKIAGEEEKAKPILKQQKKAIILVIDDEEDVRELLFDILTDSGHEVEIASDGFKGVEMFKKKSFDLVFTDLGMPGMSGWQVAEKIKTINDSVPIALITGWNVELNINKSEMKDDWIDFVVQKPFEINQILKLVQEGMVLKEQFEAA